eukprot:GHRR01027770.1.p1 GENE.GHRR01027770.1~~GHRR01027770.1.p1  ORF type:complete len:189 (-),score=43.53 GHRR01027770.1:148-714(-)
MVSHAACHSCTLHVIMWQQFPITNRHRLWCLPADPNPFFKALLKKPYRKRVVISPHVYGPSVSHADDKYAATGSFKMLDTTFGYLTKQGYCVAPTDCQRFPVAIGEFGSRFSDPKDLEHLNDFADYLDNEGFGITGDHKEIGNWFYWSWNAKSGDTGGIGELCGSKSYTAIQTSLGLKMASMQHQLTT